MHTPHTHTHTTHTYTQAHWCVHSLTHSQTTHIRPPAAWEGKERGVGSETPLSVGAQGSQLGVQLWVGYPLSSVSLSWSHTCPGKATPEMGQVGQKCKAYFAGKKEEIHASCSDASFRGRRAFLFPLAGSVSLERWGGNETKKGGQKEKAMTIIIKDNNNK